MFLPSEAIQPHISNKQSCPLMRCMALRETEAVEAQLLRLRCGEAAGEFSWSVLFRKMA